MSEVQQPEQLSCAALAQVSQEAAVEMSLGQWSTAGGPASTKLTAVQGPQLLVSCRHEASISHHRGLATGLSTWQLTTLRVVTEGEGLQRERKEEAGDTMSFLSYPWK